MTKIVGGKSSVVGSGLLTPPDNIGPRSTPNYDALAAKGIHSLSDGSTIFAGQRDDPFFADVGAIFDLVAIREGTGATGGGKDFLAGYGVHSIALQLPKSMLDNNGNHVVGIWAATDRQKVQVVNGKAKTKWVQVSRLGNPLINEVLIPTNKKDYWNSQSPAQDKQFATYYTNPILAAVLEKLYPQFGPFKTSGRSDLTAGPAHRHPEAQRDGHDARGRASAQPVDPADGPRHRSTDSASSQATTPATRTAAVSVTTSSTSTSASVGGELIGHKLPLGDGVDANDVPFLSSFPYVAPPFSGYDDTHGTTYPKHPRNSGESSHPRRAAAAILRRRRPALRRRLPLQHAWGRERETSCPRRSRPSWRRASPPATRRQRSSACRASSNSTRTT